MSVCLGILRALALVAQLLCGELSLKASGSSAFAC